MVPKEEAFPDAREVFLGYAQAVRKLRSRKERQDRNKVMDPCVEMEM